MTPHELSRLSSISHNAKANRGIVESLHNDRVTKITLHGLCKKVKISLWDYEHEIVPDEFKVIRKNFKQAIESYTDYLTKIADKHEKELSER